MESLGLRSRGHPLFCDGDERRSARVSCIDLVPARRESPSGDVFLGRLATGLEGSTGKYRQIRGICFFDGGTEVQTMGVLYSSRSDLPSGRRQCCPSTERSSATLPRNNHHRSNQEAAIAVGNQRRLQARAI